MTKDKDVVVYFEQTDGNDGLGGTYVVLESPSLAANPSMGACSR